LTFLKTLNFFSRKAALWQALGNGSVPLDVLEELVNRWIKSKQAG